MSNQRVRLKENAGVVKSYAATFSFIAIKKDTDVPVVLLKDIYEIDKNGRKVRLNKNKDIESHNKLVAADHTWVTLTNQFFNIPQELLVGDQISFQAIAKEYKIVRDDVLKQRDDIYYEGMEKSDTLFKKWMKDVESFDNGLNLLNEKNKKVYQQRINREITFDEMKKMQDENNRQFNETHKRPKPISTIKKQQHNILKNVKKTQSKAKLVDYSFISIKNIKVLKYKPVKRGWNRIQYTNNRPTKKHKNYMHYLSARSIAYKNNITFKDFEEK